MSDSSPRPVAEPDLFDSLLVRAGVEASLPVVRPRIRHTFERTAGGFEEIVTEVSARPHPSTHPVTPAAPVHLYSPPAAAAPATTPAQRTLVAQAPQERISVFQEIVRETVSEHFVAPSPPAAQHYPVVAARADVTLPLPAGIPVSAHTPPPQPPAAGAESTVAALAVVGAERPRPASVRPVGPAPRNHRADEPVVRVNIGRLEVTTASAQKDRREPTRRCEPRVSLDEFLRREHHG